MSQAALFLPKRRRRPAARAILARALSPYQFNPFDLNPLRRRWNDEVDFDPAQDRQPAPADRRDTGQRRHAAHFPTVK